MSHADELAGRARLTFALAFELDLKRQITFVKTSSLG